jgi:ubiquitin-protein ligase
MAHFINYIPNNQIINQINNQEVSPPKLKKQRLFIELEYLESNYKEVNVKMIHGKETIIEAQYPLQAMPKHIKFIIPKNYPFKNPEVFIINTNIDEMGQCIDIVEQNYLYTIHNCHLPRIQRLVKKIQEIKKRTVERSTCLKCISSIAHDNWSPTFQMKHIFEEIRKNNNLKRSVKTEIGLEEIFNKYKKLPEEFMILIRDYLHH